MSQGGWDKTSDLLCSDLSRINTGNMDVIVTQDTAKVNESSVVEIKQVLCYAAICGG